MKRIVLISCSAKKLKVRAKAETLYQSAAFKKSLEYARLLNPDKIFIISALHHLLPLDKEVEPYDVTLATVPKKAREKKPNLKILTTPEKKEWGKRVVEQLKSESDLGKDEFIILAGKEYLKPIQKELKKIITPLEGVSQGKRIPTLNRMISEKSS